MRRRRTCGCTYICAGVWSAHACCTRGPRGDRRADAAAHPRRGPRGRVLGDRAGRAGRDAPAGRVASPQGVARCRVGGGPTGRPTADVPTACRTADGARRLARAVSSGVGRAARFARAAPETYLHTRSPPTCKGTLMSDLSSSAYDGTMERTADGGVIRFERHLAYPIREVWDAITNPARLADWWLPFDADITVDLREGGQMVMAARGDEPMTITSTILRVEPPMLLEHTHVDPGCVPALGARTGRDRMRSAAEPLRHRHGCRDRQVLRRRTARLALSARAVPRRSPHRLGLGRLRGRAGALRQRRSRPRGRARRDARSAPRRARRLDRTLDQRRPRRRARRESGADDHHHSLTARGGDTWTYRGDVPAPRWSSATTIASRPSCTSAPMAGRPTGRSRGSGSSRSGDTTSSHISQL